MALHPHVATIGPAIGSARILAQYIVAVDGKLNLVYIKSDTAPSGDVTFNVLINGVSIYAAPTDRIKVLSGTTSAIQAALAVTVARGDLVTIQTDVVPAFVTIGAKLYTQVNVEDGLPTYFGGTSATSFAVGAGSKAFTTQPGLAYVVGSRVRFASSAAPTANWMEGVVTAYTGTTLTATIDKTLGSGTHTDWLLTLTGQPGADGAAGAAGAAGATGATGATGPSGLIHSVVAGTNVTVDATDPANPIVSSSGGGGGGSALGIFCPDAAYATPSAEDDEFNTGSLDGKWTAITTTTTGWDIPNQIGLTPVGSSALYGYMQTAPSGDSTWVAKFSYEGTNGASYGIGVRDSGTYWLTCTVNGNSGTLFKDLWLTTASIWSQNNLSKVIRTDKQGSLYIKLVYTNSTKKVKFAVSTDGVNWWDSGIDEGTVGGAVIDKVAIVAYGATGSKVYFDFIRKLQGTYIGKNV